MTSSPQLRQIFVTSRNSQSMRLPVSLYHSSWGQIVNSQALINSGATGCFINHDFVTRNHWPKERLSSPIYTHNADGSPNQKGMIRFWTKLTIWISEKEEQWWFYLLHLGNENLILGLPWLWETNPVINWTTGKVHLPQGRNTPHHNSPNATYQRYLVCYLKLDPNPKLEQLHLRWIKHIPVSLGIKKMTISTDIAQQAKKAKRELPDAYKEFADVFSQKDTNGLPPSRAVDHAIQLEDTFTPQRAKSYLLNPMETKVCKAFIDEHLKNGRITPSQSPQASPFFFVPKKDGTLWPCQDYHYLNLHTTKNTYPLPLISELVDKLKDSKIFTKFDIRWGYNNILIWPEDQWKVAFSTPFGLYEPTVMFFRLCNSLATFQAYMNHTFHDFIDEGWLIIYMDDMLIHSSDVTRVDRLTSRSMILTLREVLTKRHCVLKARLELWTRDEGTRSQSDRLQIRKTDAVIA